jgi:hypothetical protein
MAHAQKDTLTFHNGEMVIGEIKLLNRGTVTIETAYSESDFQIDWVEVHSIKSSQLYIITIDDGRRLYANINSTGDGDTVIMDDGNLIHKAVLLDIVNFKPIPTTFWDKFSANIDFGLNSTKANGLTQFSSSLAAGYITKRWALRGSLSRVFSRQDSIQDTKRTDGNVRLLVFLQKDWYVFVSNDFLQNDEQKLALRSTTKAGVGKFVLDNHELYLALSVGLASNNEKYTEDVNPNRFTTEGFGGVEFNMFDTGDLSLRTSTKVYPNLSDIGRLRVDFDFQIKYDLPKDFYIKGSTTVNYDNRPVEGASEIDYVYQTGIGWEW